MIRLSRPTCPHPKALADKNYKHATNKAALMQSTYGKCMYCESKISHVNFGDVEHIKPKDGSLFPHLEFEWENLGIVCSRCNSAKSNKYDATLEFIDPYNEDPSDYLISYGSLLGAKEGSERGDRTIKEIALNRADLIERRDNRIKSIYMTYLAAFRTKNLVLRAAAIGELHKEAESDKEYAFVVGTWLKNVVQTDWPISQS